MYTLPTVPSRVNLRLFRERLREVIANSGLNQSRFSAVSGIDRSTLSQLLSESNRRMPRVETLAAVATVHQVSMDWLLGLSHEGPMRAEMMREQTSFAFDALSPNDERLIQWYNDAAGFKVRHVPATLPDLLKTDAIIRYELHGSSEAVPERKIETAAERLSWTRGQGSDLECCSSRQTVEGFARGEGIWANLSWQARADQLRQIVRLSDELYPAFRWFLYDGVAKSSVPLTIFGQQRTALYLGQMYLVLTSDEHVRTMTDHFEELVRAAVVQPPDVPGFVGELLRQGDSR